LALGWAFDDLQLHRIEADIEPRNARSEKLLRALGFQAEGLLRERFCSAGEIQHSMVFGLLAREWSEPSTE